jgi:hypothetical protein
MQQIKQSKSVICNHGITIERQLKMINCITSDTKCSFCNRLFVLQLCDELASLMSSRPVSFSIHIKYG